MDNQLQDASTPQVEYGPAASSARRLLPDSSDMYGFAEKLYEPRLRRLSRRITWGLAAVLVKSGALRPWLRPTTVAEHRVAAGLAPSAGLQPQLPSYLPKDYRLVDASAFAAGGGAVFVFRSGDDTRSFKVTQRGWFVPLADELRLAHVPHTRIAFSRHHLSVVHGSSYEEPIDHGFWHKTRWSIAWQRGPLVTEVRCVQGAGPSAIVVMGCSRDFTLPFLTKYLSNTEGCQK